MQWRRQCAHRQGSPSRTSLCTGCSANSSPANSANESALGAGAAVGLCTGAAVLSASCGSSPAACATPLRIRCRRPPPLPSGGSADALKIDASRGSCDSVLPELWVRGEWLPIAVADGATEGCRHRSRWRASRSTHMLAAAWSTMLTAWKGRGCSPAMRATQKHFRPCRKAAHFLALSEASCRQQCLTPPDAAPQPAQQVATRPRKCRVPAASACSALPPPLSCGVGHAGTAAASAGARRKRAIHAWRVHLNSSTVRGRYDLWLCELRMFWPLWRWAMQRNAASGAGEAVQP
jgi:hypothetical protein